MHLETKNKSRQISQAFSNEALSGKDIRTNIDSDYRGEAGFVLMNLNNDAVVNRDGKRIFKTVISKHEKALRINIENKSQSEQGAGGIGHTGKI